MKALKGFTLIELLVTIAIAAIVVTMGIPSFSNAIRNSRLTTKANELLTSLNLARSEAIKRGVEVTISRKGGTSQNWDNGWDVFIDNDNDHVLDSGETLLKTYPALGHGFTLRTGANYDDWIAYESSGLITSSGSLTNDTFRLCATAGDTTNAREIRINKVGRGRVKNGAVSCP